MKLSTILTCAFLLIPACKTTETRLQEGVSVVVPSPLDYIPSLTHVVNPALVHQNEAGGYYNTQCLERWMEIFFHGEPNVGYRAKERFQKWWSAAVEPQAKLTMTISFAALNAKGLWPYLPAAVWQELPALEYTLRIKEAPVATAHFLQLITSGVLMDASLDKAYHELIQSLAKSATTDRWLRIPEGPGWNYEKNPFCWWLGSWSTDVVNIGGWRDLAPTSNEFCNRQMGQRLWPGEIAEHPWRELTRLGFPQSSMIRSKKGHLIFGNDASKVPIHAVVPIKEVHAAENYRFAGGEILVPLLGWQKDSQTHPRTSGSIPLGHWSLVQNGESFTKVGEVISGSSYPIAVAVPSPDQQNKIAQLFNPDFRLLAVKSITISSSLRSEPVFTQQRGDDLRPLQLDREGEPLSCAPKSSSP